LITFPNRGQFDVVAAAVLVRGGDQSLAEEFRRPHRVCGVGRLVAAGEHEPVDVGIYRDVDQVLYPDYVRLDRLERVVLADIDVFHRRRVHDDINSVDGSDQPVLVPHVPREKPTAPVVQFRFECGQSRFTLIQNPDDVRIPLEKTANQNPAD
jgi:hypothetical protein